MNRLNDTTIVIRSVGERTESLCRSLIHEQGCPVDSIFIVRKAPFSEALRESFSIGLRENKSWTFCVDADLLLRSGSVDKMIGYFEELPDNVCEVQGFILDKFFGGPRVGGVHVYRTSLLKDVINSIPDEGENIRPEAHTLKVMHSKGFPYVVVPYIVGLHDFEQNYSDIVRKTLVYSKKHIEYASLFSKLWSVSSGQDLDYHYAMKGFSKGFSTTEKILIDHTKSDFSELNDEKKEINITQWSLNKVDKIVEDWKVDQLFKEMIPMPLLGVRDTTKMRTFKRQLKILRGSFGVHGALLYLLGTGLKNIGVKIRPIQKD